jgi:hypothetical protein
VRVERAAEASGAAQAAAVRERSAAIAGRKVVPLQRADRRRAAGIAFSDLDIQCTEDLSDGVDDRVRRAVDAGDASPRTCASLPARRQRAGRACLRRCPLPQRGALIGPAYTPHAVLAISPRRSDGDPPDDRVLGSDRSRLGNAHDLPADQVWLRWITVACTTRAWPPCYTDSPATCSAGSGCSSSPTRSCAHCRIARLGGHQGGQVERAWAAAWTFSLAGSGTRGEAVSAVVRLAGRPG